MNNKPIEQHAPFGGQIADRLAIRDWAHKVAEQNRQRGEHDLAAEWASLAALSEREMLLLVRIGTAVRAYVQN